MFSNTKPKVEADCPVCYAVHDEEIHEATLRLRGWFRHQVTHRLEQQEFFASANPNGTFESRVA